MANIVRIINQQQTPIDEDKLRVLCSRKNVWDHFGSDREDFLNLSEAKQLQLVQKFYFENLWRPSNSNASSIDSSIGSAIRNSSGLSMTKVIESGDDRTKMTVWTLNPEEKTKKSTNLWKNIWYFSTESCDFSIEKANLPENSVFYVNQGHQSYKDGRKGLFCRFLHNWTINAVGPTTQRYRK